MTVLSGVEFNWLAILISAVVGMIIGALWYGPLFGTQWMKMIGIKSMADMGKGGSSWMYAVAALASLGSAIVLNMIFNLMGISNILDALLLTSLLWITLVFSIELHHALFAGRSWRLVLLDSGKDFVLMLAQAAIIILL